MRVSFALVHHANQYLITNGYDNREGISDIVGSERKRTGMLGVLAIHDVIGIPLNLHISGTLLESIAWHCPEALARFRDYIDRGLIEMIGSCYGQNIMRFFSPEYNRQQLNEQLRLYENLLGVPPSRVKTFWPPERVWETRQMAPVLRDANLLNEGYRHVILDDRTLLSPADSQLPRSVYDQQGPWKAELYQAHEIENGLGLITFPIAIRLRRSIPPKKESDWECVRTELESLLVHAADAGENRYLALYADDMEKVIGVWGADGPARYGEFLRWVSRSKWIEPVKLSEWMGAHPSSDRRTIEVGTFAELAREFEAGEGYEKWFYSDAWAPYREYFQRTQSRVNECKNGFSDDALIELAEKQLLVSNWETGWQTPATGAHGDPDDHGKPSPWARALTSHCRHAMTTAEAACWRHARDGGAHAALCDVDLDGQTDIVLKNDRLFAVINPRSGGRIVSLFYYGDARGVMAVGNPADDWHFLEDLNQFMRTPRNHPGAFADVGFEDDQYEFEILDTGGGSAAVRLVNVEPASAARGLVKVYALSSPDAHVSVSYAPPPNLKKISIECALSPDYLTLLREGSRVLEPVKTKRSRGFTTKGLSVIVQTDSGMKWEKPLQEWIGHGRTVRAGTKRREFQLWLRIFERDVEARAA
jgi:hypothetical protein